MKDILNFFTEIGKLKKMPRRGWVIRGIKNPESIAEHTFRVAIMAWVLAEEKGENLNIEKVLKMALIHDICEVYAGDTTPYDSMLNKKNVNKKELFKTWPRLSVKEKQRLKDKKFKKEKESLEKLTKELPQKLKTEIKNLWIDYEDGLSKEGRFFKQTDRVESFLQSTEYWEKNKKLPQGSWWVQAKESYDDPALLKLIDNIDKKFHNKHKPKN